MKSFACWEPTAVTDTVFTDIGALPVSLDPLFLAAHTAVRVAHLEGPAVADAGSGEQQIFDSLMADIGTHQSNSVIAVVGTPGTGKSHVVRWINAQLRGTDSPIHLLYVPREISNLKDLLKSLVNGLPGTVGGEMLTRVERAIGALTEAEVASRLTSAMAEELRWRFAAPSAGWANESEQDRTRREQRERLLGEFDPEENRRRNGFAEILTAPYVRDHLEREGGTLRNIAASIVGQIKGRDSGVTKFEIEDLQPQGNARDRTVRQFLNSVRYDPECALRLLQEALEQALPTFVGLTDASGETLETLFRDARRMLNDSKQELVLLFEDLAQFGLIDGALFNQFLIQPDDDHAPIRVIFAITNAKWEERVPEAVQRRVRYRYEILPIQEVSGDGSAVLPIKNFLARYLNLVRLGKTHAIDAWNLAASTARQRGTWVPNACMTRNEGKECEFVAECHRGFGSAEIEGIGDVGMYPFNESALERLAKKRGSLAANPGRLLKFALEEILVEARPHITTGKYPDKHVEDLFDFESAEGQASLRGGISGTTGDRLLRANIIWGNDTILQNRDILEAFNLPTDGVGESSLDGGGYDRRGEEGPPNVTRPPVEQKESLPLLREVNAWRQNPEGLTEGAISQIRTWLYSAVLERAELDQDLINLNRGVGKQLLDSVFVSYSFVFPGAYGRQPGKNQIPFEITPNDGMLAMLVGLLWYQHHGHWQTTEGKFRWPSGYRAGDLRRHLELFLDSCASRVRAEVLSKRAGMSTRDHVLGLDAIARLSLNALNTSHRSLPAIGSWSEVELVAKEALSQVDATNWLADLYAVRQGDSNQPQIIDTVRREDAIAAALKSPTRTLKEICQASDAFPEIKLTAQKLLKAIESASPDQSESIIAAESTINEFTCGEDLRTAINAASEVGNRARKGLLFRPADGWGKFERAYSRALENVVSWEARLAVGAGTDPRDPASAVTVQTWARGVVLLSEDLTTIRDSLRATVDFAKYDLAGGESATDLSGQLSDLGSKALTYIDTITGASA